MNLGNGFCSPENSSIQIFNISYEYDHEIIIMRALSMVSVREWHTAFYVHMRLCVLYEYTYIFWTTLSLAKTTVEGLTIVIDLTS